MAILPSLGWSLASGGRLSLLGYTSKAALGRIHSDTPTQPDGRGRGGDRVYTSCPVLNTRCYIWTRSAVSSPHDETGRVGYSMSFNVGILAAKGGARARRHPTQSLSEPWPRPGLLLNAT
ncbi:hypothetical protein LX32DRAFT_269561 [Colletotrichum zoysiae]|uniref:Uncharacterized protein n=1 Tax=Colletotrichum zoysiae TaxID=1216348 RepID=A0AAD9H339_9PEZI|nr:hypothetical protein LX32DRAFT_269561 [Colletotrichum zoysiae]